MKDVGLRAGVQVWVCVNEREEGARLPSCRAARGESIAQALRRGLAPLLATSGSTVWVNRTLCQGFCDASGVTVTIEFRSPGTGSKPDRERTLKFQGVDGPADVAAIVTRALAEQSAAR